MKRIEFRELCPVDADCTWRGGSETSDQHIAAAHPEVLNSRKSARETGNPYIRPIYKRYEKVPE
jgi:hypothetical protein